MVFKNKTISIFELIKYFIFHCVELIYSYSMQ